MYFILAKRMGHTTANYQVKDSTVHITAPVARSVYENRNLEKLLVYIIHSRRKKSLSPELILTQKNHDDKRGERGHLFLDSSGGLCQLSLHETATWRTHRWWSSPEEKHYCFNFVILVLMTTHFILRHLAHVFLYLHLGSIVNRIKFLRFFQGFVQMVVIKL